MIYKTFELITAGLLFGVLGYCSPVSLELRKREKKLKEGFVCPVCRSTDIYMLYSTYTQFECAKCHSRLNDHNCEPPVRNLTEQQAKDMRPIMYGLPQCSTADAYGRYFCCGHAPHAAGKCEFCDKKPHVYKLVATGLVDELISMSIINAKETTVEEDRMAAAACLDNNLKDCVCSQRARQFVSDAFMKASSKMIGVDCTYKERQKLASKMLRDGTFI